MKKASTRLLEQETQTPSPAPDLIPAESSTENLHWDWYSKRGHFSINYSISPNQITINGSGFSPQGRVPTVSFNNVPLILVSFSDVQIIANLPSGTQAASYRLRVTNSQGNSYEFDVTYGAVGPQGPPGHTGTANIGSSFSYLAASNCPGIPTNCFPVSPTSDQAHGVLVDWNQVAWDTLNAVR